LPHYDRKMLLFTPDDFKKPANHAISVSCVTHSKFKNRNRHEPFRIFVSTEQKEKIRRIKKI
jgi:hypothetical protein